MEKTVILSGDVLLPELGLSEANKERLINEVSVVFYGAALLKMDASLKTAIDVNMLGLNRTLDLAQRMVKLEVRSSASPVEKFLRKNQISVSGE